MILNLEMYEYRVGANEVVKMPLIIFHGKFQHWVADKICLLCVPTIKLQFHRQEKAIKRRFNDSNEYTHFWQFSFLNSEEGNKFRQMSNFPLAFTYLPLT